MELEMRKAKIICTLGPASESANVIAGLIRAGMDGARLNFSHGTQLEHQRRVELERSVATTRDPPMTIFQDIQRPDNRFRRISAGQLVLNTRPQATTPAR